MVHGSGFSNFRAGWWPARPATYAVVHWYSDAVTRRRAEIIVGSGYGQQRFSYECWPGVTPGEKRSDIRK